MLHPPGDAYVWRVDGQWGGLGIDFGTSSTVAMLSPSGGRARPLLFGASPLLSSGVFAEPDGTLRTGADAENAAAGRPAGFEANPKPRIVDGTVWLAEREIDVVDLIAAVLTRVVAEAERVAGRPLPPAVLTCPAGWSQTRLHLLTEAARRAGLHDVRTVSEPVAAVAYFVSVLGTRLATGQSLVVYDLGAGTFDVSVVRATGTGFEVVATDCLTDVGGLDLDAALIGHARTVGGDAAGWGHLDRPDTASDRRARAQLWRAAREAKEVLSRHPAAELHVPLVAVDVRVTREEFERVARPHLDRTVALTVNVLRAAGIAPTDVAGLFLVGGSSRVPLVATLLHRALDVAPTVIDQPELVVAEGSLHAATLRQPATPVEAAPVEAAPAGASPAADADGVVFGPSLRRLGRAVGRPAGIWFLGWGAYFGLILGVRQLVSEPPSQERVAPLYWLLAVLAAVSLVLPLSRTVTVAVRRPLRIDEWGLTVADRRGRDLLRWHELKAVRIQGGVLWAWPTDPDATTKTANGNERRWDRRWDARRECVRVLDLAEVRADEAAVRGAVEAFLPATGVELMVSR
jgi:Ethanolamine utilization protein EutJ (predicted chaperonin)